MAEINQPSPIKPVWPSRREQRPAKRPGQTTGNKDRRPQQRRDRGDEDRPSIVDDYA